MKVGILALQGAFAVHEEMLQSLGANTVQVRTAEDLKLVDALVMPGGESTTMSHLLNTSQLFDPIAERIKDAMPIFGTCAGMILLAKSIADGRPDQRFYGAIDIDIQRNAYLPRCLPRRRLVAFFLTPARQQFRQVLCLFDAVLFPKT